MSEKWKEKMKVKYIDDRERYFNDKNELLLSFSSATKPFTEGDIISIPKDILEGATNYGKELMWYLEHLFYGTKFDIQWDKNVKLGVRSILRRIVRHKYNVVAIEKHIYNDIWHGYLDIETDKKIIEIKTRTHNKCELKTLIQCEIYKKITNKPYEIWHLNRKTFEIKRVFPTRKQKQQARTIIKYLEYINEKL